jgi:hypothetical protein
MTAKECRHLDICLDSLVVGLGSRVFMRCLPFFLFAVSKDARLGWHQQGQLERFFLSVFRTENDFSHS